ncbi:MAG: hypothetical protein K8Q99_06800 [Acholeplasmataceae bacterium]|nr:hypothetical protein [Acholeplasmataceae bacterium]
MKMFEDSFLQKQGIEIIDKLHVYRLNLIEKEYNLEHTSPYVIIINGEYFYESTWCNLALYLCNTIIDRFEPSIDYLLLLELEWTKQSLFSIDKKADAYLGPLNNGLYINLNHTATHIYWIIMELVKQFDVDYEKSKLFYTKMQTYETDEVRAYFKEATKKSLNEFLVIIKRYDEKKVKTIFIGIEKLDKLLNGFLKSYKSFLLFESRQEYSNIKSKFIRRKVDTLDSNKLKNSIKYILNLLTEYYGYIYK